MFYEIKFKCFLRATDELFSSDIGYETVFNAQNNKLIAATVRLLLQQFPRGQW